MCVLRTMKGPMGWTLPSFAWYIDQTVAGAVSTGTHGSTMKYGTLSGQVSAHGIIKIVVSEICKWGNAGMNTLW